MKIKVIAISVGILIISSIVFLLVREEKKVGYVDLKRVIESFDFKIQQEGKLEAMFKKDIVILDSLKLELNKLGLMLNNKNASAKQKEEIGINMNLSQIQYDKFLEEIEVKRNNEIEKADAKIYNQLNQYLKDFGTEKNYLMIVGGKADGTIMYVDENADITNEVIKYVNNKYNGKK